MRLREATKLEDGDKVRCGPNLCGCNGSVVTVRRYGPLTCGCVFLLHDDNPNVFARDSSRKCNKGHKTEWLGGREKHDRILARNLRRA